MISWLFLFVCLIGAGLVWNVYRPRNGEYTAAPSFFVGWLTGELAIHHILWQGVATVFFVWAGALEAWPGRIGLGIALVSWFALGLHTVRGFEVRGVVTRALADALGRDHAQKIRPGLLAEVPGEVDWLPILKPFPISHAGVQRQKDVVYGRAAAQDLKLDVYRPASGQTGCPVFVYVHGGGWVIGTKDNQGLPLCWHLASRGWVCVNVNYRLSPGATFPEHLVDLKRALAWVREHGESLGADTGFVAVSGGSAGGHLASLVALTQNAAEYQPEFEDADTSIQAAVPIYGVYDFFEAGKTWGHDGLAPFLNRHVMKSTPEEDPEAFRKASPLHCITPDAPPFFVVHGEADTLVPAAEAREFVAALRERSKQPAAYTEIPGAQHAFEIFPSVRSQITRSGIEVFLSWAWSRHLAAREEGAAAEPAAP
jgi:acetyl esterase/lipase